MKSLTILFILVALSPAMASSSSSPIHVISTKTDIFYFKVDKSFMGATVEVYSDGNLIRIDTITHHRNIIDFYLENAGIYEIKIKKDGREEAFTYEKTEFIVASKSTSALMLQPVALDN